MRQLQCGLGWQGGAHRRERAADVGRVAVIVFATGLGLTASGLVAIISLFETIGAFGEAQTVLAHVEALAATLLVLAVGSGVMLGTMFVGTYLVLWAVP